MGGHAGAGPLVDGRRAEAELRRDLADREEALKSAVEFVRLAGGVGSTLAAEFLRSIPDPCAVGCGTHPCRALLIRLSLPYFSPNSVDSCGTPSKPINSFSTAEPLDSRGTSALGVHRRGV